VFVFVLSGMIVSAIGPYNLFGNQDPEYMELFNSLSLGTFHVPVNLDHPGTPVQELGAAVILGKWLGGNLFGVWAPLEESVLTHAEDYLHAINFVLNVLLSVTLYFAARRLYRRSRSLVPALALQCSFFLFWEPMVAQSRVMPELLLISVTYLLIMILVSVVWNPQEAVDRESWTLAAMAGAIFALGVVTKLSFLPLASTVLLFRGWRRIGAFCSGAIAGGALVTLPVITRLPSAARYFWRFMWHTGYYGAGSVGLPPLSVLKANLAAILGQEPFLAAMFVAYSIALTCVRWDRQEDAVPSPATFRTVVLSGWITTALQILLVTQHFRAHYLLPAMVYAGFVNAVLVDHYASSLRRRLRVPLAICCVAVGLFGAVRTAGHCVDWAAAQRNERADSAKLLTTLKTMPECIQMGYDFSVAPMRALHFGNALAGFQQGWVLATLYPDSLSYTWQEGKPVSFSGEDRSQQLADLVDSGRCVLLVGKAIPSLEGKFVLPPDMAYRTVSAEGSQGIYRLVHKPPPAAVDDSIQKLPLKNLALGKATAQSSGGAEPGRAIDGNTDGAFFHGSVTHTQPDENSWWQVDLGDSAKIYRIAIWNRTDCCSGRLSSFWVFASNAPFAPSDKPASLQHRPGTWSSFQSDIPSPNVELSLGGVRARYVRVQLAARNPLSLAEVQVYGLPPAAR
jgi:hypothetical protein